MKKRSEFTIKSSMAVKTTAVSPVNKKRLDILTDKRVRPYLISFVIGLVIGLVVLGWGLFPVQWTDVPYTMLGDDEKVVLLDLASDLNAYNPQSERVINLAQKWGEIDDLACATAELETDPVRKVQLMALAYRINGKGCIHDLAE